MNTTKGIAEEIRELLESKQYIVDGEKHRRIIRSMLEENERFKTYIDKTNYDSEQTAIKNVQLQIDIERITKERDHWNQMYKIAKEEWEQVKKDLDFERTRNDLYKTYNDQYRSELAAKDKVLKDISTNSLCSWAKDYANGILAQYVKEAP